MADDVTDPGATGLTLAGKAVLVTGATQGLGAEIAREAARRGAAMVGMSGRSADRAEGVIADLMALGTKALFLPAELADADAAAALVGQFTDRAGRIDGLVNAAGITDRASMLTGTAADWDRLFAVNGRAPFLTMQAMIRSCLDAGRPGSIVNISSYNAHCGAADLALYSATKGALNVLTRNAAHAHMADRIRVNAINMGWSPTDGERDLQARQLGKGEGWLATAAAAAPLGRLLRPAEVARLCVYLLSDYAGLQTGTITDLEQRVPGAP